MYSELQVAVHGYSDGQRGHQLFYHVRPYKLGKETDEYNIQVQRGILCLVSVEVLHLESNQLGYRFIFFFMKNSNNLMEIWL